MHSGISLILAIAALACLVFQLPVAFVVFGIATVLTLGLSKESRRNNS